MNEEHTVAKPAPFHCWVCGRDVNRFLPYGIPERRGKCPHCGAKPRYRAVIWFLRRFAAPHLTAAAKVLEIGASGLSIRYYPRADTLGGARYTVIDTRRMRHHRLLLSPHRFLRRDITHSDLPSDCYDLVLCNNTLPYIREDRRALEEIRRILKPAGLAMLNTHWQSGPTLTATEHQRRHPGLSWEFYAENGDQWVYGEDFPLRVREAGLELRTLVPFVALDDAYLVRNGLKANAMLVIGWKQQATTNHPLLAEMLTTLPLSPGE